MAWPPTLLGAAGVCHLAYLRLRVRLGQWQGRSSIIVNDYTPDHTIIRRLAPWLAEPCFAHLPVNLQPRSRDEALSNRAGNTPGGRAAPGPQPRPAVQEVRRPMGGTAAPL